MPYSITWEPPFGVHLHLHGVLTAPEFVSAVREVHSSPAYDTLRYVIDDLSELDTFDVPRAIVLEVFAASIGAGMVNPNRKIYVVTTNELVLFYLRMVGETYAGALPIHPYPALEEARKAIAIASEESHRIFRQQ